MPKHHITFEALDNGDFKAVDILCGIEHNGATWYCSKQCMENKECYDISLKRYSNDNGEIMND